MADRAEKCAEEKRCLEVTFAEFWNMNRWMNLGDATKAWNALRSHYPDDRELLEAEKDWVKRYDEHWRFPESKDKLAALMVAEERLRTAIERKG